MMRVRVPTPGYTRTEAKFYRDGFRAGMTARRKHPRGDCAFWAGEYLKQPATDDRMNHAAMQDGVDAGCTARRRRRRRR